MTILPVGAWINLLVFLAVAILCIARPVEADGYVRKMNGPQGNDQGSTDEGHALEQRVKTIRFTGFGFLFFTLFVSIIFVGISMPHHPPAPKPSVLSKEP